MQTIHERHLPIDGTFNVRDLGGYPLARGKTRWRRVLRSDGLHRLDDKGMARLLAVGVATIIDLRHDHECETQPNPFAAHPAVAYHHISLFDQLAPAAMSGRNLLYDLYIQALAHRQEAIAQVLRTVADAPGEAVLFHCTAGKDRTGIIAALLLATAGVETGVIVEDYALTKARIAPMISDFLDAAAARGTDIETIRPLLACEPETMAETIAYLIETYSSVESYLAAIGLSSVTIARLKTRLVEDI
jgi:protein-tyrosine phosphatase